MGLVERAKNICLKPKSEWTEIAGETTANGTLIVNYVLPFAAISAVASAGHYFQMFWTQINFRVQQRRRGALLVKPEEKPQDVLTR